MPKGWLDAALQFALFYLAYSGYQVVRGITDSGRELAHANAEQVIEVERSIGTFFEPGLQQALIDHVPWIVDVANFAYLNSHFVVTSVFLIWLYLYRNDHFYFVRNMFMVAMGIALVGYTLVPTAPPRFFEELGFTDTLDMVSVNHDSALVQMFVNPYAAIPSMHCAFSLMIGATGALVSRHAIPRVLWCAYPVFVFFVVVVTGNHFWVDGAIGWMVAGLAALGAMQLARVRPAAWSWRQHATA